MEYLYVVLWLELNISILHIGYYSSCRSDIILMINVSNDIAPDLEAAGPWVENRFGTTQIKVRSSRKSTQEPVFYYIESKALTTR